MPSDRAQLNVELLATAFGRLEEAFAQPVDSPLALDGTIQRFEFVFELFWKTFKIFLDDEGITTNSPKAAIQAAYRAEYFDDESAWLALLRARNETSHTYNDQRARRVYALVQSHMGTMRVVLNSLRQHAGEGEDSASAPLP